MATDQKHPSLLDYNRFGNDTPNWAANLAPVNQAPKPQPKLLAVLPTKPIANNAAQPVTTLPAPQQNRLPYGGETQTILDGSNSTMPTKVSATQNVVPRIGMVAGSNPLVPELGFISKQVAANQPNTNVPELKAQSVPTVPQAQMNATPKAPSLGANPLSQAQLSSLMPTTKLAGNLNSNPLPDNQPSIKQYAQEQGAAKAKSAGNGNTKPAKQTPAVAQQSTAQQSFDDPYAAYKARTGIDLSNVSHAPVPSYVQQVNQTQGMDFNGKPVNADGSPVVPVETQDQFNQRWAQIQDFYNSPEGQAVINARNQGDVVEVQRGDKTSYTDLRNGGTKGIQDYIADQAAKDSALAKSPSSAMNNRELNQLDLLKPKLAADTELSKAGIAANADRDVAGINNADEAYKTKLLEEYMNPNIDPKRKEQLAPYFARKDNNEIVVQGGEVYNEEIGQMQKVPSYVYDPSIKDYRYPKGTQPNAAVKPTRAQFLEKAKAANPNASEAELTAYYNQKYGK